VDAVTPDLLLLLAMIGAGLELLRTQGWRPVRLGAWLGFAYLVKTSVWPWLLVTALLGVVSLWRDPVRRTQLRVAVGTAVIPIALWIAAMSVEAGGVTLGSSGRLSACWYLWSCDGRTPDSHSGTHADYHQWVLGSAAQAKVATFDATQWTYAPWSDPTAWQRGVLTQAQRAPTLGEVVRYVGTQLGLVLGVWMGLIIAVVLLPTLFTTRGAPPVRHFLTDSTGAAVLLGGVGILQFVAVHAEPRLIAPFTMLLALGWITWRSQGTPRQAHLPVALCGLAGALGLGVWHLRDQSLVSASATARTVQLEARHPPGSAPHRVAVLGPALPMMPDLYRARARVFVQVMQPTPDTLDAWPAPAQAALTSRLRELGATSVWISRGRSAYRVVPLEAVTPP
jgi:hypothetical protein